MYFQTLDDKGECVGVYKDGELYFNDLPQGMERTWKYAEYLEESDVEYASLYGGNRSLNDVCPAFLIDDWVAVEDKLKAYYRSFVLAKVNMDENCFFDLVPRTFLLEYCEIRNKITQYVFENYEKPQNYDFMVDLTKVLARIRHQRLNIDVSSLSNQAHLAKFRKAMKKFSQIGPYCRYNINGTKTGRLTTQKNSFPVMTMDKDFRSIVKPTNDWFVELDFNAAEVRTLMALGGRSAQKTSMTGMCVTCLMRASHARRPSRSSSRGSMMRIRQAQDCPNITTETRCVKCTGMGKLSRLCLVER